MQNVAISLGHPESMLLRKLLLIYSIQMQFSCVIIEVVVFQIHRLVLHCTQLAELCALPLWIYFWTVFLWYEILL